MLGCCHGTGANGGHRGAHHCRRIRHGPDHRHVLAELLLDETCRRGSSNGDHQRCGIERRSYLFQQLAQHLGLYAQQNNLRSATAAWLSVLTGTPPSSRDSSWLRSPCCTVAIASSGVTSLRSEKTPAGWFPFCRSRAPQFSFAPGISRRRRPFSVWWMKLSSESSQLPLEAQKTKPAAFAGATGLIMNADLNVYAVISPLCPWILGSGYAACAGLGREVNMNKRTIAHVGGAYKRRIATDMRFQSLIRNATPPEDRLLSLDAQVCNRRTEQPAASRTATPTR